MTKIKIGLISVVSRGTEGPPSDGMPQTSFREASGVIVENDHYIISDSGNCQIRKISHSGTDLIANSFQK
jgi:hypothetical protein